jgi:hypothetical protein
VVESRTAKCVLYIQVGAGSPVKNSGSGYAERGGQCDGKILRRPEGEEVRNPVRRLVCFECGKPGPWGNFPEDPLALSAARFEHASLGLGNAFKPRKVELLTFLFADRLVCGCDEFRETGAQARDSVG